MNRHRWEHLSSQQSGRYAEYFVKMEFTMHGFEVYSFEVDDRGIDFVVRRAPGPFWEVQVKSLRGLGYVFMTKAKMPLTPERLVVLALFTDGSTPTLYAIPALAWKHPNALLVDRAYEGRQSAPEWGVNVSKKNMPLLERYRLEAAVDELARRQGSQLGSA